MREKRRVQKGALLWPGQTGGWVGPSRPRAALVQEGLWGAPGRVLLGRATLRCLGHVQAEIKSSHWLRTDGSSGTDWGRPDAFRSQLATGIGNGEWWVTWTRLDWVSGGERTLVACVEQGRVNGGGVVSAWGQRHTQLFQELCRKEQEKGQGADAGDRGGCVARGHVG